MRRKLTSVRAVEFRVDGVAFDFTGLLKDIRRWAKAEAPTFILGIRFDYDDIDGTLLAIVTYEQ